MQPVTANPFPAIRTRSPTIRPTGPGSRSFGIDSSSKQAPPANLSALFVVNVDGSGLRRLTPWRDGLTGTPSWSPDGTVIVFRGDSAFGASDAPGQLFLIRPNGSHLRQLTFETNANSYWPSWSPDGKRIVFTRYVYDSPAQQLYTIWPDGTHLARLKVLQAGNQATWVART